MKILLFLFLFLLIFSIPSYATRSLKFLEAELKISGKLEIFGDVRNLSLRVYIPQEGIKSIKVFPKNWKFVEDSLGNSMVEIFWSFPNKTEYYEIILRINNYAKEYDLLDKNEWLLEESLKFTSLTNYSKEIEEFAKKFKGSELFKAVKIFEYLVKNFEYDYSVLTKKDFLARDSKTVWEIKKGVSGELSNLLVTLLRINNIPARVVFSYALTSINQTSFDFGHGWAEAYIDGRWIPFDITFENAVYLPASHIKFANLLENNAKETISWIGNGNVNWIKYRLRINLLNYVEEKPKVRIELKDLDKGGKFGLIIAKIDWKKSWERIKIISCISNQKPFLEIFENDRMVLLEEKNEIAWLVKVPSIKPNQVVKCPITYYDKYSQIFKEVEVNGNSYSEFFELEGEEFASINQKISLFSKYDGIFFSPQLNYLIYGKNATFSFKEPSKYKIYFFSKNFYSIKNITVYELKELEIVEVIFPKKVFLNQSFEVEVKVRNLVNKSIIPKIEIKVGDEIKRIYSLINPNETKNFKAKFKFSEIGKKSVFVEVENDQKISWKGFVEILEKKVEVRREKSFFDLIREIFSKIGKLLGRFF